MLHFNRRNQGWAGVAYGVLALALSACMADVAGSANSTTDLSKNGFCYGFAPETQNATAVLPDRQGSFPTVDFAANLALESSGAPLRSNVWVLSAQSEPAPESEPESSADNAALETTTAAKTPEAPAVRQVACPGGGGPCEVVATQDRQTLLRCLPVQEGDPAGIRQCWCPGRRDDTKVTNETPAWAGASREIGLVGLAKSGLEAAQRLLAMERSGEIEIRTADKDTRATPYQNLIDRINGVMAWLSRRSNRSVLRVALSDTALVSLHFAIATVLQERPRARILVSWITGGEHSPRSYHYAGKAVDLGFGGDIGVANALCRIAKQTGAVEVIGPDKAEDCNKDPHRNHETHVHLAWNK